jgi:hypothetical protein
MVCANEDEVREADDIGRNMFERGGLWGCENGEHVHRFWRFGGSPPPPPLLSLCWFLSHNGGFWSHVSLKRHCDTKYKLVCARVMCMG